MSATGQPIRSIEEVRILHPERAALALEVDIEAQVLKRSPSGWGLFVHDDTTGIYVDIKNSYSGYQKAKQGDYVRIRGRTDKGNFIPHIVAKQIDFLESRPLPVPLRMDRERLLDPKIDCRWVELEGVVIDNVKTGAVFSLRLACYGEVINLVLPRPPDFVERSNQMLNHVVRVRGIAATRFNPRRQMTGRIVQVNSLDDVSIVVEGLRDPPIMNIDQLLRMETGSLEAIRVRGRVTFSDGKHLYLQGPEGSLAVVLPKVESLEPGLVVEATGTVVVEPFSPALRAWEIKVTGDREPVSTQKITLGDPPFPIAWHQSLVSVEAELVDVLHLEDSLMLQCTAGGHFFGASLSNVDRSQLELEPGAKLLLQGICVLRSSEYRAHTFEPDGISLILRNPADVTLLERPPWWTTRRVIGVSAAAALLAFFSLVWVGLLRSRVADQTKVIRHQVEREVTMKERERLARELHDSLEQNIAGLTRQLSNASLKVKAGHFGDVADALFLAQRMAAHCQRESRESIYDLRKNHRDGSSSQWYDELLLSEAEALGAEVHFTTEGKPQPRDGATGRHVSKIVREAVYNGLRHGGAKRVDVLHRETNDGLEVEIRDNGSGFDPSVPPARGHFGLYGMRERAEHVGAKLSIVSQPGNGTVVSLKIPN